MSIKLIINKICNNGGYYLFYVLLRRTGLCNLLSDLQFTKIEYRANTKQKLNLDNPQTYNEKLQWLKLYDRKSMYTTLVDKYLVKEYVTSVMGNDDIIIPTIGMWKTFDEIDFSGLPCQFVLKTNHSGGNTGVVICKDFNRFNIREAKAKLEKSLKTDVYKISREWPYKNVERCIIAEKYMEDEKTSELRDYKFFCFNGEPKALFVATGRQQYDEPRFDFFDAEFNHLDLRCSHPQAEQIPEKPQSFEQMLEIARKLSKGFPQLRVDLYEINGKPYFGEMTLFHWEGLMPFYPEEWNYKFGSWIELPKEKIYAE